MTGHCQLRAAPQSVSIYSSHYRFFHIFNKLKDSLSFFRCLLARSFIQLLQLFNISTGYKCFIPRSGYNHCLKFVIPLNPLKSFFKLIQDLIIKGIHFLWTINNYRNNIQIVRIYFQRIIVLTHSIYSLTRLEDVLSVSCSFCCFSISRNSASISKSVVWLLYGNISCSISSISCDVSSTSSTRLSSCMPISLGLLIVIDCS